MHKQSGYLNMDFTGFFVALFVVGIAAGLAISWLLPAMWNVVKPWLHSITG